MGTDMMSKPMVQESIVAMLENHLKNMNVKTATHLVLMAMQRTSFGSDENVLDQMFDTWEPLLSTTFGLLGPESLVKVCQIHANVEKIATTEQQKTLRILTKKVLAGLNNRAMAKRLEKGMWAALSGNHDDILKAIQDEEKPETSHAKDIVQTVPDASDRKNESNETQPAKEKKGEQQPKFEDDNSMHLTSEEKRKFLLSKNPNLEPPKNIGRAPLKL